MKASFVNEHVVRGVTKSGKEVSPGRAVTEVLFSVVIRAAEWTRRTPLRLLVLLQEG